MRLAFSIVATITLAVLLAYAAWLLGPAGQGEISYTVIKPVFETKTIEIAIPVLTPDGKIEKRVRTINYTVSQMVPEQRIKTIPSGPTEKLRWWVLVGCAVLCGAYSVFVLGTWMKMNLDHQQKASRKLPAMEKRLNNILSFGFGAIAGILTVGTPGVDLEKEQAFADIQSLKQQLEQVQMMADSANKDHYQTMQEILEAINSPSKKGSDTPSGSEPPDVDVEAKPVPSAIEPATP